MQLEIFKNNFRLRLERYLDFVWQFILNFKGVTSVKQVTEKVFMDGTREKVKDQVDRVDPLF